MAANAEKVLTNVGRAGIILGIAGAIPYNCLYNGI